VQYAYIGESLMDSRQKSGLDFFVKFGPDLEASSLSHVTHDYKQTTL